MERYESRNQALETLYDQYANTILKVCYSICRDYESARNITQEVFLALLVEYNHIDIDRAGKWLLVTAKNKALNYVKRCRREIPTDDFTDLIDKADTKESAEETFFDLLDEDAGEQRERQMLDALYRKNERWYLAITMTYYLGYTQIAAAEKLGMSVNAFYVMMNRAKKWLAEYYEKWIDAP